MEYYFNFSESLSEKNGAITNIIGSPKLVVNNKSKLICCEFDGRSGIQLPSVSLHSNNFSIEAIFSSKTLYKECGIFGSDGFRLAFRQNKKSASYTCWINFPSSSDRKQVSFDVPVNSWYNENYIVLTRNVDLFSCYFNYQLIGQLTYSYSYSTLPIYIGYYYDKIYGFDGYIREYKLSTDKVYHPNLNPQISINSLSLANTVYQTTPA